MKYEKEFTTMWHDTNANRTLTPTRILAYMQETGNLQCKDMGFFLDEKRDNDGVGFILGSISVDILKPIYAYEKIKVSTWCKPSRSYSFTRYFTIERDGEIIAKAYSLWALVDVNTKGFVKGDESFDCHFPIDEPISTDIAPMRVRIKKDEELTFLGKRKISYSDIDYNMHMNNTKYPDMICDYIEDIQNKHVVSFALSYLKEAALNDEISVFSGSTDENGFLSMVTCDKDGNRCLECKIKVISNK